MANTKDKERTLAQELYLAGKLNQKEIAGMVGVTEKTIGVWVEGGRWEALRAGRMSTPGEVVANMLMIQKERTAQMLQEMRDGGTTKFGDELLKMSMAIEKLQGQTSITTYIGVLQELMGSIPAADHKFRAQLAHYQSIFLNLKAGTNG